MNANELDQVIVDWAHEGPDHGSRQALDRALAATRRVDQRPGWTFPHTWLPRPLADLDARAPRFLAVVVLLMLLALLLIASAIVLTGTESSIRSLLGPSADRLVAFQEGTSVVVSRVDGTERRVLSGEAPYARGPLFSPDGTRVAFVVPKTPDGQEGRLLVVPVDGPGPAVDVSRGWDVLASEVGSAAWSPDGQQLAFASVVDGVATIFVAEADGSGSTPISDETADRDQPTWSTDGAWILYRQTDPDGTRRRYQRMRPDGSEVEELNMVIAPDSSLSRARQSPVSESLSYTMNLGYGASTTAVIDFGFGHMAELWGDGIGGISDLGVPWSPDGRFLAFLSADDGVIVADDDPTAPYDGELHRLGPVADCWVDWSPDGTALFGGSPGGCASVVVIPLADPTAATTLPGSGVGVASWQPLDG